MSFRNLTKNFRYVNENGQSLTFVYEQGFVINKPKGIDTLSIRHSQAQGINQVGSTIQSSNVQSRPVTVSGILVGSFQAENKEKLLSVVRPDLSARLYADDYYLEVRPTATPTIEPKQKFAAFQFQLLAAYPYWQKDDSASATLSGVAKRFKLWDNAKAAMTGGNGRWWNISGGGSVHSESGSIVSLNNSGNTTVTSLSTAINPMQDLHGYDSPWPTGGGKNKASLTNPVLTTNTQQSIATFNNTGTFNIVLSVDLVDVDYTTGSAAIFNLLADNGNNYRIGTQLYRVSDNAGINTLTRPVTGRFYCKWENVVDPTEIRAYFMSDSYGKWSGQMKNVQVEFGTSATDFAPYSNICPISGFSAANIVVSPTTTAGDGTTYTVSFGAAGTVYGGTLDVVNGTLTVTHGQIASYAGETLSGAWISDRDAYAAGTTPTTGAQVVYELATPQTYTLTPTEVVLLTGANNVWSDTGDVSLVYDVGGTPYRFGEIVSALFINVKNDGQVPIPYTVTFKALAEVQNPKLIDAATNKYLLLNKTLVAGEKVVVEITHERTYVNSSVDGECRGALDLSSSFYRLAVGDNVIKPDATSGKENLQVDIDFATEVVGIAL